MGAQGFPWEGTLGSPGIPWEGPLGAQGIPWEGSLGSPRDPMGGDPWEPMDPMGGGWGWVGRASGVLVFFLMFLNVLAQVTVVRGSRIGRSHKNPY